MFTPRRILYSSCLFRLRTFSRINNESSLNYITKFPKNPDEQVDFLKATLQQNPKLTDWDALKEKVLNIGGNVNQKNIDGIFIRVMVSCKQMDTALMYADYLKKSGNLSLGSINGIFIMYGELAKLDRITEDDKKFIVDLYNDLYKKYKILDFTTSENLLRAMCAINEYKYCFKLLDEIKLSGTPSHSAYSSFIATLFNNNKLAEAKKMISQSTSDKRPLKDEAYEAWIKYVFRKYKTNKVIEKHLDTILFHVSENFVTLSESMADRLVEIYSNLGWDAALTSIKKDDGACRICKNTLQNLTLNDEEFKLLQDNVKEKLIVGSDLFIKTSPAELERFLVHLKRTSPYDIVLDGLNIALAVGTGHIGEKVNMLMTVVQHFLDKDMKILLLGRKHMLRWPRRQMEYILANTCSFFTEDLTHDDPYFITAALYSGPHTDIVSKDLLRGHKYTMKDERLSRLFQRWQWQHQWMVFTNRHGKDIQPPLRFTPCAQQQRGVWHLPFQRADLDGAERGGGAERSGGAVRRDLPQWSSWLCLRPQRTIK